MLGVDLSTVYRWTRPRPQGTGGLIPAERQAALIREANKRGIALTPWDFFDLDEETAAQIGRRLFSGAAE